MGEISPSNILFDHLIELGCCNLCCLRYLGERSPSAYKNPVDTLKKVGSSSLCHQGFLCQR